MQDLLENVFKILTTIAGIFYFGLALLLARTIGYRGIGFKFETNNESCKDCLAEPIETGKKVFGKEIKFNIKKNTIFIIWLSFVLGCAFIGNSLTGYLDILTSIDWIGAIISLGIIACIILNAILLVKIIDKLNKKEPEGCLQSCTEHFKLNLIDIFSKIKIASFTLVAIISLSTIVILFAPKTFKKMGKK